MPTQRFGAQEYRQRHPRVTPEIGRPAAALAGVDEHAAVGIEPVPDDRLVRRAVLARGREGREMRLLEEFSDVLGQRSRFGEIHAGMVAARLR